MTLTVGRIENLGSVFPGFSAKTKRDIKGFFGKPAFEQKEAEVLRACMQWLGLQGYFAWRSNNAGVRVGEGANRYAFHGVKGVPDICCVHHGRFIGIECKATKGKQSPAQAEFQKRLEAAGGKYILARSLAALIEEMGNADSKA